MLPLAREWRRLLARRTCALDRKVADWSSCAPTRVLTDARPRRALRRLAARYAGFLRVERVSAFGVSDGHFYRLSVLARAASGVTTAVPTSSRPTPLRVAIAPRGSRAPARRLPAPDRHPDEPARPPLPPEREPADQRGQASRRDTLGFADWLGISRTSANAAVSRLNAAGLLWGLMYEAGDALPFGTNEPARTNIIEYRVNVATIERHYDRDAFKGSRRRSSAPPSTPSDVGPSDGSDLGPSSKLQGSD